MQRCAFLVAVSVSLLAWAAGTPVRLEIGGTLNFCATGDVVCPVYAPNCDDPAIAVVRDSGGQGFELVGLKPGTTECSVSSSTKVRKVYRVTVLAPAPLPAADASVR
jgi:hypothetical protein